MDRLTNRRRKEIESLSQRKYRKRLDQTLVEGRRGVEAALDAGAPLTELIVSHEAREEPAVRALCDRASVPVHVVSARELAALSDVQTSQEVLAVADRAYVSENALLDTLSSTTNVLVLDRVQDPGNVGTILRTAAWFGAEALVAGPGTAGLYGPKVMRAAAGGHWDVRLTRSGDLPALLGRMQHAGVTLYGADMHGTRAGSWAPERPSALVMGSEAHGLSHDVEALIQDMVALPGHPRRSGTESLNVAVAAGILVYEWLGQANGPASAKSA